MAYFVQTKVVRSKNLLAMCMTTPSWLLQQCSDGKHDTDIMMESQINRTQQAMALVCCLFGQHELAMFVKLQQPSRPFVYLFGM